MASISLSKFQLVLQKAITLNASDIHLSADNFVYLRRKNELKIDKTYFFSNSDIINVLGQILSECQRDLLKRQKALDCAYAYADRRFRLNVFQAGGKFNLAVRLINKNILNINSFITADILKKQLQENKGLILICGATGTGKSTTLASMLEYINRSGTKHIITLEDPIEYIFTNNKSLIQQREYNEDFSDFAQAVKMALRQDPDILMIGEIRDTPTMQATLAAAETGHLVLGTLHAGSAVEALSRMESFFPPSDQNSILTQIAQSLNCIIVQKLLPTLQNELVCCMEILLATSSVRNIIRQGQNQQLVSQMQLNRQKGMQTMQDGINYLLERGIIDKTVIK